MNLEEIRTLVERVKGTYPNFNYLGAQTLSAWLEIFKAISADQADKALTEYVQKGGKYAPTPADLLKLVKPENQGHGITRILMHDKYTGADFIRKYNPDGSTEDIIVEKEVKHGRWSGGWVDKSGYIYAAPEG